jgi:hypothetical protein
MAEWSSSYVTALPDSAFACIDSSGRHYPHHDKSGKLDLPHLRNAMSRVMQEDTTSCGKAHLMAHAKAQGMGGKMEFLKAEQLGSAKWRVLAIPFGGEFNGGKDSDGEFFSPRTDIRPKWFNERPVLFNHGQDEVIKEDDIGVLDDLELDPDVGWWANVWLDRSHRFHAAIDKLLRAGKMYGSSGSIGHLVRVASNGEILLWPLVEETLTPIPANRLSRVEPAKALADFTTAGMSIDAVKALIEAEPDSLTADLRDDLSMGGEPSGDLSTGGGSEAIQRLDPKREAAIRHLAGLAPRLGKLAR